MVASLAIVGLAVSLALLPSHAGVAIRPGYERAMSDLYLTEQKALDRFKQALDQFRGNQITSEQLADRIEHDVLPQWREMCEKIESVQEVPQPFQADHADLLAYLKSRQAAWEYFALGLRSDDHALSTQAQEEFEKANRLASKLRNK